MLKQFIKFIAALAICGALSTITACNASRHLATICGESFCVKTDEGTKIEAVMRSEDFNTYRIISNTHTVVVYEGNHPKVWPEAILVKKIQTQISEEPAELYELPRYFELRISRNDASWPQYLVLYGKKGKVGRIELERLAKRLSRKSS